jgi:hypothetical protein
VRHAVLLLSWVHIGSSPNFAGVAAEVWRTWLLTGALSLFTRIGEGENHTASLVRIGTNAQFKQKNPVR